MLQGREGRHTRIMRHVNGLTTVRDMLPDVSDIQFISDLDVSRDDIIVEAVRDGSGRNLLTNNLDTQLAVAQVGPFGFAYTRRICLHSSEER